jgi:hypothetical protein
MERRKILPFSGINLGLLSPSLYLAILALLFERQSVEILPSPRISMVSLWSFGQLPE